MSKCIFLLLLLIILPLACDFVDEPIPTANVGVEQAFSSPESVEAIFVGIYNRIRTFGDGDGDDSEAIGAILNTWNVKGNDIIRPQFHWFVYEYRYQDNATATGRKSKLIWNEMYEIIGTCNTLIVKIAGSNFSEGLKTRFMAEARAIRGWAYHHLIRDYAQPYSLDEDAPGVPIYTEVTTVETSREAKPRSSVGEVYDQIASDLEFAVANLTGDRPAKWAINQNVANGLLARVYLYMKSYEKAAKAANLARQGYELNAGQYRNGFQDIGDEEWMWGAPYSNDQTLYYGSFGSFWDGTRYPRFYMNPTFVAHFSDADVRNMFTVETSQYPNLYRTSKFVAASDFGEDLVLMRVAEMYLIEAEALARMGGRDAEAAELLYTLQSDRDNTLTESSGNTGEALVDEIMLERRKELYGEFGPDFIDARRLGIGLLRDSAHTVPIDLKPGDPKYIQKIPQAEIDSNSEISEADQNP